MSADLTLLTLPLSFILDVRFLNNFHENRENFKKFKKILLHVSKKKKKNFLVLDLQLIIYTSLGEDLSKEKVDT